jgi:hypothetical protein
MGRIHIRLGKYAAMIAANWFAAFLIQPAFAFDGNWYADLAI